MVIVIVESVSAMLATLETTVTAPLRQPRVCLRMAGCAVDAAAVCVAAASALSLDHLGTHVRSAPPAPMPVPQRGKTLNCITATAHLKAVLLTWLFCLMPGIIVLLIGPHHTWFFFCLQSAVYMVND